MNKIDDKIKKILDIEQEEIINSREQYILVSACPGSGKTYTVVKKIEKELKQIEEYQGIIACSFTKEASAELKSRIDKKISTENCFIGTIDSLVKNMICKFVNRKLLQMGCEYNQVIIKNNVFFPEEEVKTNGEYILKNNNKKMKMNEVVRLFDVDKNIRKIGCLYMKEWLEKLKKGEYEISFPSYIFAMRIVEMDLFLDWFNNKFTTIYIDEAQDLNCFQHEFFNKIKEKSNVNIVMVGDANQSIYQFRGARPELFKQLVNKGYKEYKINVSVRCHPSIIYYSNKIYNPNIKKNFSEERVKIIEEVNEDFLRSISGNMFILVEDKDTATNLYEKYKDDFDLIYTKKMDIDKTFEDYHLNCDIIDELLRYYLNYDNVLDKYKYSYEKIEPILLNCNLKVRQSDFDLSKIQSLEYFLKKSSKILGIELSDSTICEIKEKLEDERYKYYYYSVDKKNKIMTIHASKGLENENVIIILNNPYNKINDEFKNKLFVAITRAKNNAYILSENNDLITNYIKELLN